MMTPCARRSASSSRRTSAGLSPASVQALRAQGGPLDGAAVVRFETHPGAAEALLLRRWDEAAKDPGRPTGDIGRFLPVLGRVEVVVGRPRRRGPTGATGALTPTGS